MKWLWRFLRVFLLSGLVLCILVYILYGGGRSFIDLSTEARYDRAELEEVFAYSEPIGNVAVSKDTSMPTRLFFTVHPESRPQGPTLLEVVDGQAIPYPNVESQNLFQTPLGVFTDDHHRLWVIDHGNHGLDSVMLTAFHLKTDQLIHRYAFPREVARRLSFFNDLSVSPDGQKIVVANVSFFGKKPSIAAYDMEADTAMNRLVNHYSVRHEKLVPVTPQKKMRFFGGLVDLLTGVDGIDFSRDGRYVYYASMGNSGLFRIATDLLFDPSVDDFKLKSAVERVSDKPLSDGIRTDLSGNVYLTDIEHQGIYLVPPHGEGFTLIRDERIDWADGLSLGGDGMMYLADSDIPNIMLKSKKHIARHAPYRIFRFPVYE